MARVPEIIRRGAVSQVAVHVPKAGDGWAALANAAKAGADFVKPAAIDQARENGLNALYRDVDGKLKVDLKGPLSGELGEAHNVAAKAKFLATRSIDLQTNMSELAAKYEFDPAGFKEASGLYIQSLKSEEGIDAVLKDEIVLAAEREASSRFNGLNRQSTVRDQREADQQTAAQRDLLAQDYANLVVQGDGEAAQAKYQELERITEFRATTAWIRETPAEAELYLRKLRGAAKIDLVRLRLGQLIGRSDLSQAEKDELDKLLNDADIAATERVKLDIAAQGRLKQVEANGLAESLSNDSYEGRIIHAESAGRNTAQNPNSTALGPHQFLKGTWKALVKRHKPEWAKGLTDTELLALRADRAKSSEMFAHFRRENQDALRAADLPVNHATEYLAHFFGAGGAIEVLKQEAGTLVSEVVEASVIKANPFLSGMTVRDVQNWAARKMTLKARDISASREFIDHIDDIELRSMATKALNDVRLSRGRQEEAAAEEYASRIENGDISLTEQEIFENHDLSDADQISLANKLHASRKAQLQIQQTIFDLDDESVHWNARNSKQKTQLDELYLSQIGKENPISKPEYVALAASLAKRTGFAPRSFADALFAGVQSSDPEKVGHALELFNLLDEQTSGAFSSYEGSRQIEREATDYRRYAKVMSPTEAGMRIVENRENVPKNISEAAKKHAGKLKLNTLIDHFDTSVFSSPRLGRAEEENVKALVPFHQEAELLATFRLVFIDEFELTGDVDRSVARTLDYFDRSYGVNEVSGPLRIMRHPPQKHWDKIDGSHEWMTQQLEDEISHFVFGDNLEEDDLPAVLTGRSETENRISAKHIYLVSDDRTNAQVSRGEPPSYQLYYLFDDVLNLLPARFTFDPSLAPHPPVNSTLQNQNRAMHAMGRRYMRANPGLFNPKTEIDRFERKAN
ncbi:hypothetical protein [Cognatishimia activa]|uniref:Uncharacterized protein n=1 Tax=Cognatishimia activa TaxID=1715691 RepID=A0A975I687_9RHOB|nr:hypothetical protein [Cognatishimia activa]QTN34675.1 hypothetical protein HZ995_09140 [Cognatishimia activa]